jgi:murein DD-endopeptidase MepM/ murein hydrolase activator NlpD
MVMTRRLAMLMLFLGGGYLLWVAALNLPGNRVDQPVPTPPPEIATTAPLQKKALPASGLLMIPVAGVSAAQLSDTFDDARGDGRVHDAIDIMAPRGTAVIAAAAGVIEKLFESERGGTTMYIRRTGGQWIDYYAHLDAYAPGVTEGQRVSQGQVIGTVGSTGDASAKAPHLHYAINLMAPGESWWQGRAVNPYPLLKASY